MDQTLLIVVAAAAVLVIAAVLLTRHLVRSRAKAELEAAGARAKAELDAACARAEAGLAGRDKEIAILREQLGEKDRTIADARQDKTESVALLKENYNRMVTDLKASHEKALGEQLAALRHEMSARTEELLKAREDELKASAESSFKTITGALDENVRAMKEAFEKNKEAQTASSASLWMQLETAVGALQKQAVDIGSKAEIYEMIQSFAAGGMSVIMITDELEELLTNANRVMVMAEQRCVAQFNEKDLEREDIAQVIADLIGEAGGGKAGERA